MVYREKDILDTLAKLERRMDALEERPSMEVNGGGAEGHLHLHMGGNGYCIPHPIFRWKRDHKFYYENSYGSSVCSRCGVMSKLPYYLVQLLKKHGRDED